MEAELNITELISVETGLLTVTVKGAASHPSFPGVVYAGKEASLRVSCDDLCTVKTAGEEELFERQNLGRAFVDSYRLRPIFFEQQRYEIVIEPAEGHTVEFWHENYHVRKNVTPIGRQHKMLSGIINFGNDIGLSDLVVRVDKKDYLTITIEVFPSKIGYKDDYKAIVADVTQEVYNLAFDFLKRTYESFDISATKQSSPVEFFAIIRKIYGEFMTAADMVISRPHHILEAEHAVLPSHKIKRTDNRTLRWIEKHPEHAKRTGQGIMVDRALAVKKHVTYDTKENQLTKYMLERTIRRLLHFKKQYLRMLREPDLPLIRAIDGMIRGIERRCSTGFMREVQALPADSGMSLVFSMAPGYRDLYRCYLLLQHGLSVTGSIFNMSVKDLAVLYEYWCFIKLNSLMKERYKLLSQDIIKVAGNGLFVSLIKGQRSHVRYLDPENGEIITLSYNPREYSGATVPQKPDNVLRLEKRGANVNYEYVFDAKYRINPALDGSMYQQCYKTPGPQEDDINTMHRYRDAIVYQSGASPYERTMFGAYVLFPYKNENEYKSHHFFESIEKVNIGGLPFLPSATGLVTQMLDELIADSPASAFERATLPLGIEEKLARVDWAKRDVLVGTFGSTRQFAACLEKNFYYIPKALVGDSDLPIHYVALYQTRNYFSENAGIRYVGEVLRTALVRRETIRQVPVRRSNPDELYYYFSVREWVKLEPPVMPRESGFSHAFTNMFLLENSEYVPELLIRSEEEYRFYTELKRRTGRALEGDAEESGFELGGIKVLFEDRRIRVFRDGREVGGCGVEEFARWPGATFRRLAAGAK